MKLINSLKISIKLYYFRTCEWNRFSDKRKIKIVLKELKFLFISFSSKKKEKKIKI